jgi:hypothetical protein
LPRFTLLSPAPLDAIFCLSQCPVHGLFNAPSCVPVAVVCAVFLMKNRQVYFWPIGENQRMDDRPKEWKCGPAQWLASRARFVYETSQGLALARVDR